MSSTPGTLTNGDLWLAKIYKRLGQISSILLTQSTSAGQQPVIVGNGYTISTVTNPNDSLTGPYFANTIQEIDTNNQIYIAGVDFTQSGMTITLKNGGGFSTGQVLIAKI